MSTVAGDSAGNVYTTTRPTTTTVAAAATAVPTPTPASAPAAPWYDAASLAASYGFSRAFFGSDPELANLIQQAVNNQWDVNAFQAHFMDTNWYRTRSAAMRQWQDLVTRDPTEANAKIAVKAAEFKDTLSQYGVTLDDPAIQSLATQALQYQWSPGQVTDILTSFIKFVPGQMGGTPAAVEMQVDKMLGDYGLTATNDQIGSWVRGVMNQSYTQDNLTSAMRDMAKSKYPGMNLYLDQGMTVRDIASPYVQSYSQLMEVNPNTVDLKNPLIQQALQGTPPQNGQPPQMQTVYGFEQAVRRDPAWLRTKNARDSLVSATQGILKDWGLVG